MNKGLSTLLSASLLVLVAGAATGTIPAGADRLGLYTTSDPLTAENFIPTTTSFQSVTLHLCATNVSAASGISGWECLIDLPAAGIVAPSWAINFGGTNFSTAPRFDVGIGTFNPAPWAEMIALASVTFFVTDNASVLKFFLHGTPNPSLGPLGWLGPVFAAGNDATDLRPLGWPTAPADWHAVDSGYDEYGEEWPIFVVNAPEIANDDDTWGAVKTLFR